MERKYRLTIPEPCTENWDKMTPKENGRFCLSCSKTVVDFTSMLPNEVQHFFIQNQNQNICGRFKNEQLETITIQIPSQVLYSQIYYHKMFLLALFIAMGTTLFSCQDKNGNKNKIDKIEIVDNTENYQDENDVHPSCYGHKIESKKRKTKEQFTGRITQGAVVPSSYIEEGAFKYNIIYNSNDLDMAAVPKNGIKKFNSNFSKNLITAKQGEISLLFVIEGDGSLSNFNILENTTSASEKDIIGILEKTPKWIPGKRKNRIVRSTYTLQVPFK